jgi:hypothetical protein
MSTHSCDLDPNWFEPGYRCHSESRSDGRRLSDLAYGDGAADGDSNSYRRESWESVGVADILRYRFDFLVPEIHDIGEEHSGIEVPVTPPPRNPTLDRLRGALAEDPRWGRSMLAPWRPFGQYQHLIVWIDLTPPESEEVIRDVVTGMVNDFLPGVRLAEMTRDPF